MCSVSRTVKRESWRLMLTEHTASLCELAYWLASNVEPSAAQNELDVIVSATQCRFGHLKALNTQFQLPKYENHINIIKRFFKECGVENFYTWLLTIFVSIHLQCNLSGFPLDTRRWNNVRLTLIQRYFNVKCLLGYNIRPGFTLYRWELYRENSLQQL